MFDGWRSTEVWRPWHRRTAGGTHWNVAVGHIVTSNTEAALTALKVRFLVFCQWRSSECINIDKNRSDGDKSASCQKIKLIVNKPTVEPERKGRETKANSNVITLNVCSDPSQFTDLRYVGMFKKNSHALKG